MSLHRDSVTIELVGTCVTVVFDGMGYTFTDLTPTIDSPRARAVIRALLSVAIDAVDAMGDE